MLCFRVKDWTKSDNKKSRFISIVKTRVIQQSILNNAGYESILVAQAATTHAMAERKQNFN